MERSKLGNRIPTESGRELEAPEMSNSPIDIQENSVTERLLQLQRPQYGTVSVISKPTHKRYRLPFFILLVFEWAVIVFLSVIDCAEVRGTVLAREVHVGYKYLYGIYCSSVSYNCKDMLCSLCFFVLFRVHAVIRR